MTRKILFAGISAAALAAGSASAQQTTNTSTFSQFGSNNTANVDNARSGNQYNSSTVVQNGTSNVVNVLQVGTFNRSYAEQLGNRNNTRHEQNGNRNNAETRQDSDDHGSTIRQAGDDNLGLVSQRGSVQSSAINQAAANNQARVTQTGAGNISEVVQESAGNIAQVLTGEGSVLAPNRSTITQRNTLFDLGGNSNNSTDVAIVGQGNRSRVTQDGRYNQVQISMLSGGVGGNQANPDDPATPYDGNRSTLSQVGQSHAAGISIGSRTAGEGKGNQSIINQRGSGTRSEVWQRGVNDQSTINQNGTGPTYASGATLQQAQPFASVSQRQFQAVSNVSQSGDNFAEVTQGLGSNSSVTIDQIDSGDTDVRQSNQALVAQYGDRNTTEVRQDAMNGSAVVWQQARLVQSSVSIDQGKGSVDAAAFTAPNQPILYANGDSRDVQANVHQSGAFNATLVRQDGVTLRATVDQGGTGTAANRNSIRIEQTGSGHSATARQFEGVGPSDSAAPSAGEVGDPFSRAAGVQSAEIVILQSNMNNSATVEQFGRGQFARIEQTGQNNIASIAQQAAATNAVAVIRQTGNGNSYSVQQTQAGQYIMVTQAGTNNTVTDVVRRGP